MLAAEAGSVRGRGARLLRQLHHPRLHAAGARLPPPQPLLCGQGGPGQYQDICVVKLHVLTPLNIDKLTDGGIFIPLHHPAPEQ